MSPPNERIIEYGRSKPPISAARVFAGVCSVPAGLFGIGTAIIALAWLVRCFSADTESMPTRDRHEYIAYSSIGLAIALVALIASVRWARYAIRGPRDGR
jgi:hypothetical protein